VVVVGQERVEPALKLIELQEKTAKLGVNITPEVRQLVGSDSANQTTLPIE
jgi:hypothetical protein